MVKWFFLLCLSTRLFAFDPSCHQILVVLSENWDTSYAKMWGFEKSSDKDSWRQTIGPVYVQVGKNGMAPAKNFSNLLNQEKLKTLAYKHEGDGKTPAGIFEIETLFGFHSEYFAHMPYLKIHKDLEAVDDPKSKYYNQIINVSDVKRDWKSTEKLSTIDVYEYGIVIDYNQKPAIENAGSCIFMHIWKGPDIGTDGCIAMDKHHLLQVMNWLNKSKNPMIAQMPEGKYQDLQESLELPKI